jgi:hypothetical protein
MEFQTEPGYIRLKDGFPWSKKSNKLWTYSKLDKEQLFLLELFKIQDRI